MIQYQHGKLGIHTNDFDRIATIFGTNLSTVFFFFLVCTLIPPIASFLAYQYREQWIGAINRMLVRG